MTSRVRLKMNLELTSFLFRRYRVRCSGTLRIKTCKLCNMLLLTLLSVKKKTLLSSPQVRREAAAACEEEASKRKGSSARGEGRCGGGAGHEEPSLLRFADRAYLRKRNFFSSFLWGFSWRSAGGSRVCVLLLRWDTAVSPTSSIRILNPSLKVLGFRHKGPNFHQNGPLVMDYLPS